MNRVWYNITFPDGRVENKIAFANIKTETDVSNLEIMLSSFKKGKVKITKIETMAEAIPKMVLSARAFDYVETFN